MQDKIQKVIDMYEASYDSFQGVFVYKNLEPMDTDFTSILYYDGVLYFEFCDVEIEDFKINAEDITDISFDIVGSMTVSIIKTNNGDTVMIHNL